jgi:hypothetical protein
MSWTVKAKPFTTEYTGDTEENLAVYNSCPEGNDAGGNEESSDESWVGAQCE